MHRALSSQDQKRNSPLHTIAKTLNIHNKVKLLRNVREKSTSNI